MNALQQNLSQDYKLTQEALPSFKLTKGRIINLICNSSPQAHADSSDQAAVNGIRPSLTEEWSRELKPYHISVNGVIINNDFTDESPTAKEKKCGVIFTDAHHYTYTYTTQLEEAAQIILYLLSENAKGITGQLIEVNQNLHLKSNMN